METLLSQAEQLEALLSASRSGLVRTWSPETLSRSLSWARFFRRLHLRLGARSGLLRAALERRLNKAGLSLGHLRRCPELLSLALLENEALPPAARSRLLRSLLFPEEEEEEREGESDTTTTTTPFVYLLSRRKAASQLLLGHHLGFEGVVGPVAKAHAQLLLSRLKEGGAGFLEQLPRSPALFQAVASALLLEEEEARSLLLPWLLLEGREEALLHDFFLSLPASTVASLCGLHLPLLGPYLGLLAASGARLHYDPLRGEWRRSEGEDDGVSSTSSFEELAHRLRCLLLHPQPLQGEVLHELKRLRDQEGDYYLGARGLNVWSDLLLELEGALTAEPSVTQKKHLGSQEKEL